MQVFYGYISFIGCACILIGVWSGEDQRNKHCEDRCSKEIGPHLQILIMTTNNTR
jgi:hypothetical protein